MAISTFELFSVGIGPSSSHTVGPMKAARLFVTHLENNGVLERTASVNVRLFGSLGATGKGHGTDKAVIAGLSGLEPECADPTVIANLVRSVAEEQKLSLGGMHCIPFAVASDVEFAVLPSIFTRMR